MGKIFTRAQARVGLLGNPSDIYGGRGLGFNFTELGARVELTPDDDPGSDPGGELGSELLAAGWSVARAEFGLAERPDFTLGFECDVPFQSGLSGSSAILIAALLAIARHVGRELKPERLAELAWLAETRELGLLAGPLDRLVQAFGGLVFMDFARPFEPGAVEALDPAQLPPLLVAWNPAPGERSGDVHAPVRARFEAGDAEVRGVLAELAELADAGREALARGERDRLCDLIDRNFDLRASLFSIGAADRSMIELGRRAGAATKFCGSGGSVLAVPRDGQLEPLRERYHAAGFETLLPTVAASPQ